MPNESEPSAAAGIASHALFAEGVRVTAGVPTLDDNVENCLGAVPFCTAEKFNDVGEKNNLGPVTVSVMFNVPLLKPKA